MAQARFHCTAARARLKAADARGRTNGAR